MAVKRKLRRKGLVKNELPEVGEATAKTVIAAEEKNNDWGEPLDPQEEKVLDWILKGVVAFILGWLGLSILLVIGGYFGLWK